MVEAAIVFPLVILTVVGLIEILVFFYQLAETGTNMHVALRAESGRLSKTVVYGERREPPCPIYKRGGRLYYSAEVDFLERGLLRRIHKHIAACQYVDHEAAMIRGVDLAVTMMKKE